MARRKRKRTGPNFDLHIFLAGQISLGHSPSEGSQKETIICLGRDNKIMGFFPRSERESYTKVYSLMKAMRAGYAAEFELVDLVKGKWPLETGSLEARAPKKPKTDYSFTPEVMRAAMNDVLKRTERIPYMREAVNELRNLTPGNRAGIEGILDVFVKLAGLGHRRYVSELAGILSMCHDAGLLNWDKPAEWTPEVIESEIPHLGAALNIHIPKIAAVFEALFERGILTCERPDALSVNVMGMYSEHAIAAIDSLGVADLAPIVAKALEVGLLQGEEPATYDRAVVVACRDNLIVALDGLPAEREAKEELERKVEELEGKVKSGENLVPLIKKGFEAGLLEGEEPETYDETNIPEYTEMLMSALDGVIETKAKLSQRVEELEGKLSTKESRSAYSQAQQLFEDDYATRAEALAKLDEAVDLGNKEAELAKSLYTKAMETVREGEGGKAENTDALKALKSMQPDFNVKVEIDLLGSLEYAKLLAYRARRAKDPTERTGLYEDAKRVLNDALKIEPAFKGAQLRLEEYTKEAVGQDG